MSRGGTIEVELRELLDAQDPRTIAEMKEADTDSNTGRIKDVSRYDNGYSIEFNSQGGVAVGIGLPDDHNPDKFEPKVGDTITVYGGLGRRAHGIDINGREMYWLTPLERVAEYVRWLADHDRRKREEFAREKPDLDGRYDALPAPLKARIDRFRGEAADFRIDAEGYELFCCAEAAKFAQAARDAVETGADADAVNDFWARSDREAGTVWEKEPDVPEVRWLLWAWALNSRAYDYDHERQRLALDCDEGHSGNTFGGAMLLAHALLEGRDV